MQLKNKVMAIANDGNGIGHTAVLLFTKGGSRKSIFCFLVIVFFTSASLYSIQNINTTKTSQVGSVSTDRGRFFITITKNGWK